MVSSDIIYVIKHLIEHVTTIFWPAVRTEKLQENRESFISSIDDLVGDVIHSWNCNESKDSR
jgi:hypothetical protein